MVNNRKVDKRGIQMNSIELIASGMYLPKKEINNKELNTLFHLKENWIYQRTGIQKRYWVEEETSLDLAIKAVENLKEKSNIDFSCIGLIIVASTNVQNAMPGISFEIQKYFAISNCICMDLLAGCSGYINAVDIARKYLELDEIKYALVIGVETLSKYLNKEDVNTSILLGDGAGATILGKAKNKKYAQNIESIGGQGDILTCKENEKIFMDGKKVYKFATARVAENIKKLLDKEKMTIEEVKYIVPHQSNIRILNSMADKIGATNQQMYINISNVGNIFNASIPIALNEILDKKLLKEKDKIMLVGYGGGLNLGSILIEI